MLFTAAVGFSSAEERSTAPRCHDREQLRGVAATGSYCWWVDDVVQLTLQLSSLTPLPSTHLYTHTDAMLNTWPGGTDTVYSPVHPPSLPPLHTHPTITMTTSAPPPQSGKSYSPRASPVHVPFHSSSSTKSSLAELQHSRNMREMALLAEKVHT